MMTTRGKGFEFASPEPLLPERVYEEKEAV
jgi:hypothetical protein